MSDQFFQAFLSLKNPELPLGYKTEHFSYEELQELLKSFSGGNVLDTSTSIGTLAEFFYNFETDVELFQNESVKQMWQDGLCSFIIKLCEMIDKKRPGYIER